METSSLDFGKKNTFLISSIPANILEKLDLNFVVFKFLSVVGQLKRIGSAEKKRINSSFEIFLCF